MQIQFNVTLTLEDYSYLQDKEILHVVWQHFDAMTWLEDINCTSEFYEGFNEAQGVFDMIYTFYIDEHILDMLLLKWPTLLEPIRDFEHVKIIRTN